MHMRNWIKLLEDKAETHILDLPDDLKNQAIAAFNQLADGQRYGDPEKLGGASLLNKGIHVSGLYAGATEHVGDITNRMAKNFEFYKGSFRDVVDKVEFGLRRPGYDIIKQVNSNYRYNSSSEQDVKYRYTGTFDDYKKLWKDAGKLYADAHAKLIVWNEAQWCAREAAICFGLLKFDEAHKNLDFLKKHLKTEQEWQSYAGVVHFADGQIAQYRPSI